MVDTTLQRAVAQAFAAGGPLARSAAHLAQRSQQQDMARAVTQALEERSSLVVEAGTGVGKTFAYLVPLLLSGQRALVSTATKGLQDQLFLRDLPMLREALGVNLKLALLKGRASYLCHWRLRQARQDAQLPDRYAVRTLARVETWAQATRTGDLAEIEGLDDRSPVIPLVTSTRDNCLGSECAHFKECHVVQARREAMLADVVVINHHLFFADLALRDSGVAELLPTADAIVFDEAHQLADTGVQFLGQVLSTAQALDLARDALAAGLGQARGLQPWQETVGALQLAARELRLACASPAAGEVRGIVKLRWPAHSALRRLQAALPPFAEAARQLQAALLAVAEAAPDFPKLAGRATQLVQFAEAFMEEAADGRVRWLDLSAQHARLVESPLDIAEMLTAQRAQPGKAWVFTSATLGDDERLSWFTEGAGLQDARVLRLGSPFDYAAHARVWVPAGMAAPSEACHPLEVGRLASRLAQALNGRTFVLTTTLRVLQPMAEALRADLELAGHEMQVLVQGSQPRRALLQRFLEGRPSVLLGSHSFWEGIDVPGDALQCVVIDKLPFPPPNDPLVEARVKQLRAQGRNPFDACFVSAAAVALKQGAGRLIRSESDCGLLVLCDSRLSEMAYGRRLLAALPPMRLLNDEAEALDWLALLAAAH